MAFFTRKHIGWRWVRYWPRKIGGISPKGAALITGFEGFVDHAYRPVASERYLTIAFGHYGPDVRPGQRITRTEGLRLFEHDVRVYENAVKRLVRVPLNQNEFDALVSFVYNLGIGTLQSSTLLRKLNAGDRKGAANEFHKFVHGGGQVLPGLVRRRRAERALFLKKR